MTRNAKLVEPSRLSREIQETVRDMYALGIMDDESYAKITLRHLDKVEAASIAPMTGDDIRALRAQAKIS